MYVKNNMKSKLNADQQNMHGESAFHMYLFTCDFSDGNSMSTMMTSGPETFNDQRP